MRKITPIEKLVLEQESDEIGGMILLILGEPGAGKTMGLVRMVENDLKQERIPMWRGQEDCQWILLAAQGLPITFWMHESIEDFQFYLTGSKKDNITKTMIDVEEKADLDVEIKEWSDPEELVSDLRPDRVNVHYIPGAGGEEKEKYFFIKKNFEICQALVNRDYGDHVTFNADEINDVVPDLQRKPFYDLLMHQYPSVWKSMRKNNTSKRGLGHGYSEINHKFYNDKANGIGYMQGARVHSQHQTIDQNIVNGLHRGEIIVSGWEKGSFDMPNMPHNVFDWIPESKDVLLKMDMKTSVPDVRPQPDNLEDVVDELPIEPEDLRSLWTPSEYAEEIGITTRAVQKKLATNKLPGMKIGGKWFMSEEELVNKSDVPF